VVSLHKNLPCSLYFHIEYLLDQLDICQKEKSKDKFECIPWPECGY